MDVQPVALNSLKSAFRLFRQDLEALPEEAFTQEMGGKARTVADIVYEVNLVNDDITANMRGEGCAEWPEGWIKAPEGCRTKQEVIAAFDASSQAVLAQVEAYSEHDIIAKVTTEHGETDRFERCRFMAMHTWYHSGQLNFIQTLLGDDAWHWS